jgi:hypothetical protein
MPLVLGMWCFTHELPIGEIKSREVGVAIDLGVDPGQVKTIG